MVANPEQNGRIHSNWLTMMLPRLKLAKSLLTMDGAILVSYDEGEHPRLRLIMDELYGQNNFVADFVWVAGYKNDSKLVSVSHEYIVCYARDRDYLRERKIQWRQRKKGLDSVYEKHKQLKKKHGADCLSIRDDMRAWYRSLSDTDPAKKLSRFREVDGAGVYSKADISWPGGGGPKYDILHPVTNKPVKTPSRGWMTNNRENMQQWMDEGRVHFGEDERSVPSMKCYLQESESGPPYSVFYQPGTQARRRLRKLMGGDIFDFPKDEFVLRDFVEILTEGSDIVLDFFAGSSTTAHAVMMQNAADGCNRKFIMVQLDEDIDRKSPAYAAGFRTIAHISRDRIRRAGTQILDGSCHPEWRKDVGFRLLKIDSSNMIDVYYAPEDTDQLSLLELADNVKADRTPEDLLFQVMIDWGVDLTLPIRKSGGGVFFVDENALIACFDIAVTEELIKELAQHMPQRVVFRDAGFASDSVKINYVQIFRLLSPGTEVKSI